MIDIRPSEETVEIIMTEKQARMLYALCGSIAGGYKKVPLSIDIDFANGPYRDVLRDELTNIITDELYELFGDDNENT